MHLFRHIVGASVTLSNPVVQSKPKAYGNEEECTGQVEKCLTKCRPSVEV
jgi:hypothetical protein